MENADQRFSKEETKNFCWSTIATVLRETRRERLYAAAKQSAIIGSLCGVTVGIVAYVATRLSV